MLGVCRCLACCKDPAELERNRLCSRTTQSPDGFARKVRIHFDSWAALQNSPENPGSVFVQSVFLNHLYWQPIDPSSLLQPRRVPRNFHTRLVNPGRNMLRTPCKTGLTCWPRKRLGSAGFDGWARALCSRGPWLGCHI